MKSIHHGDIHAPISAMFVLFFWFGGDGVAYCYLASNFSMLFLSICHSFCIVALLLRTGDVMNLSKFVHPRKSSMS